MIYAEGSGKRLRYGLTDEGYELLDYLGRNLIEKRPRVLIKIAGKKYYEGKES